MADEPNVGQFGSMGTNVSGQMSASVRAVESSATKLVKSLSQARDLLAQMRKDSEAIKKNLDSIKASGGQSPMGNLGNVGRASSGGLGLGGFSRPTPGSKPTTTAPAMPQASFPQMPAPKFSGAVGAAPSGGVNVFTRAAGTAKSASQIGQGTFSSAAGEEAAAAGAGKMGWGAKALGVAGVAAGVAAATFLGKPADLWKQHDFLTQRMRLTNPSAFPDNKSAGDWYLKNMVNAGVDQTDTMRAGAILGYQGFQAGTSQGAQAIQSVGVTSVINGTSVAEGAQATATFSNFHGLNKERMLGLQTRHADGTPLRPDEQVRQILAKDHTSKTTDEKLKNMYLGLRDGGRLAQAVNALGWDQDTFANYGNAVIRGAQFSNDPKHNEEELKKYGSRDNFLAGDNQKATADAGLTNKEAQTNREGYNQAQDGLSKMVDALGVAHDKLGFMADAADRAKGALDAIAQTKTAQQIGGAGGAAGFVGSMMQNYLGYKVMDKVLGGGGKGGKPGAAGKAGRGGVLGAAENLWNKTPLLKKAPLKFGGLARGVGGFALGIAGDALIGGLESINGGVDTDDGSASGNARRVGTLAANTGLDAAEGAMVAGPAGAVAGTAWGIGKEIWDWAHQGGDYGSNHHTKAENEAARGAQAPAAPAPQSGSLPTTTQGYQQATQPKLGWNNALGLGTGPGQGGENGGGGKPSGARKKKKRDNGKGNTTVVAFARKWLGTPYVYGGGDRSGPTRGQGRGGGVGFDCSGFTLFVFSKFGVSLPHNAAQQARSGQPVGNIDAALPGDLLVLNGGEHCGIYEGNGMVIHAPHTGDVVKESPVSVFSVVAIRRLVKSGQGGDAVSGGTGSGTGTGVGQSQGSLSGSLGQGNGSFSAGDGGGALVMDWAGGYKGPSSPQSLSANNLSGGATAASGFSSGGDGSMSDMSSVGGGGGGSGFFDNTATTQGRDEGVRPGQDPNSVNNPQTVDVSGSGPNVQRVFDALVGAGFTKQAAAGVVGNLMGESGINPNAIGDNGTSGGIGQWHSSRFRALKNYAKTNHVKWNSLDTQVSFMLKELSEGAAGVSLGKLKAMTDVSQVVVDMVKNYERPANIPGAITDRLGFAQGVLKKYGGDGATNHDHGGQKKYSEGAWRIGADHNARVHEGEMILPKNVAEMLRTGIREGFAGQKVGEQPRIVVHLNATIHGSGPEQAMKMVHTVKRALEANHMATTITGR